MISAVAMTRLAALFLVAMAVLFTSVPSVEAIKCYSCNSADNMDGEDCSDSPVDDRFLKNCDEEYPSRNYTVCRILVQSVEGDSRIVRTCGTNPYNKPLKGCVDRTGTKDIKLQYCDCHGDACNGVDALTSRGIMTSIICLLVIALRLH